MAEYMATDDESETIPMELTDEYDDVVAKLSAAESEREELRAVVSDFGLLLDTFDTIDGGTKSLIVGNLPGAMAVAFDSDAVVNAMQVLERYDLVSLDGNTWKVAN